MFSVHITPEEFKNVTITGHFGFVFEENSIRKSLDYCNLIVFEKLGFQNVFRPALKRKAGVLKFLRFQKRFRKAPYS